MYQAIQRLPIAGCFCFGVACRMPPKLVPSAPGGVGAPAAAAAGGEAPAVPGGGGALGGEKGPAAAGGGAPAVPGGGGASMEEMVANTPPPEIGQVPMDLVAGTYARKGARRALTADAGSSAEAPQQKAKRGSITLAQKIAARVNNLECMFCKSKDTDPDPISPSCRILWNRYKTDNTTVAVIISNAASYATEGRECAYCGRTKKARFSDYGDNDSLLTKMGNDADVCETFNRFKKWLIQQILERFEATLGGCGAGK